MAQKDFEVVFQEQTVLSMILYQMDQQAIWTLLSVIYRSPGILVLTCPETADRHARQPTSLTPSRQQPTPTPQ